MKKTGSMRKGDNRTMVFMGIIPERVADLFSSLARARCLVNCAFDRTTAAEHVRLVAQRGPQLVIRVAHGLFDFSALDVPPEYRTEVSQFEASQHGGGVKFTRNA